MNALYLIAGWFLAAASVVVLTPIVGKMAARFDVVDRPDGLRKRHARVVPNVGGLAMAAGFAVVWILLAGTAAVTGLDFAHQTAPLWIGAALILAAGLYDDVFGLRTNYKFLMQVAAAYSLIHAGFRIDVSFLPFVDGDPYVAALYSLPLTIVWTVAIINAVNLLDGLDGLAAGVCLVIVASLTAAFGIRGEFALFLPALILTGVLAGFLVHNSHPATIFMGDCGSMLIGYAIAAMTLGGFGMAATADQLLVGAVVLGLPFVDTAVAMARRLVEHRPIFDSDHDHIHHRLLARYGHRRAVFAMYGVSLVFGIMAVLMAAIEFRFWIFPLAALAVSTRLFLSSLDYPTVASVFQRLTAVEEKQPRIVKLRGLNGPLPDERADEQAA